MNKSIFIGAGLVLCSFASFASLACNFNVAQLPLNTEIALSQTIFDVVIAEPAIGVAITNARDEWDSTNAVDRVGNWSGVVTASDCPDTSGVMQIGALAFDTSNCQTLINYNAFNTAAFVDLFDTRSITINLNLNP